MKNSFFENNIFINILNFIKKPYFFNSYILNNFSNNKLFLYKKINTTILKQINNLDNLLNFDTSMFFIYKYKKLNFFEENVLIHKFDSYLNYDLNNKNFKFYNKYLSLLSFYKNLNTYNNFFDIYNTLKNKRKRGIHNSHAYYHKKIKIRKKLNISKFILKVHKKLFKKKIFLLFNKQYNKHTFYNKNIYKKKYLYLKKKINSFSEI